MWNFRSRIIALIEMRYSMETLPSQEKIESVEVV